MNESKTETNSDSPDKDWLKLPVANLLRHVSSGIYFARFRVGGKLIRKSLKTNVLSVAKLRLRDLTFWRYIGPFFVISLPDPQTSSEPVIARDLGQSLKLSGLPISNY